jgi:hypothetical protein
MEERYSLVLLPYPIFLIGLIEETTMVVERKMN